MHKYFNPKPLNSQPKVQFPIRVYWLRKYSTYNGISNAIIKRLSDATFDVGIMHNCVYKFVPIVEDRLLDDNFILSDTIGQ